MSTKEDWPRPYNTTLYGTNYDNIFRRGKALDGTTEREERTTGRSIIELEESRKLLNRLKEHLTPQENRIIDTRIARISELVTELTH